jgi:hypothetical protein
VKRRGTTRAFALIGVVAAASVAALGGASQGKAAAGMSVTLSPLIGTPSNQVQQVTYGAKIGYHLEVANTGDSNANHVTIVVQSDSATFSDSSRSECAVDPQNAKRMVCALRRITAGSAPFLADLRFTAPSTGSSVVTTPSVTVDAQTVGGSGNNGTTTTTGPSVTTALVSAAANSLVKTFAKEKETVSTSPSLPQHSSFTLPNTLLSGFYGVPLSVQETTGTALCDKCPSLVTDLQIPASLLPTSPFSAANPFSFTVTLEDEPAGYKPTGLYHDGVLVGMCSATPLGPSTHICLTSFDPSKKAVVAKGIADQNGRIGFG